jgi:hypothetical protein
MLHLLYRSGGIKIIVLDVFPFVKVTVDLVFPVFSGVEVDVIRSVLIRRANAAHPRREVNQPHKKVRSF